ncbi:hypothetical protein Afil01_43530 [Actinorhabdospora filicis]|uniref:Immunity protein Imm1 n=1 Tax=Actinorhabdospora filicis TaxID=1785913 RepID=A0A9W6SP37_9ACTN|nr:Imm1 family immunity protein [Actinorhabdospora filicis]GLZ79546.1 hypothetical protein Afil01_43530 [Actinorhabdospora filicis]
MSDSGADYEGRLPDAGRALLEVKVFAGGRTPPTTLPAAAVKGWLAERVEEWSDRPIPGLVALEGPAERVLEVLVGHPSVSFLVWHEGLDEIACSVGTVEQPADLAFDYGGHRTTPYADAAVPPSVAAEAVAEFIAGGGERPAVVGWKEPGFA